MHRCQDLLPARPDVLPCQQRTNDVPAIVVLLGRRKADRVVVRLVAPVELVEPVPGVVAVGLHGLRAQHVASRVEERDALSESHDREAELLHPDPVVQRRRRCGRVLDLVEERLVVVGRAVVDGLARVGRVADALEHPPAHLASCVIDEAVGREITGHAYPNPVHLIEECPAVRAGSLVVAVRVEEHARGEALFASVAERSAPADGIADAVVERADAGARHVVLRRVHAALAALHLAEVPALAVEVDGLSVHSVGLGAERVQRVARALHVGHHVMAHEVEAEAVDLEVGRPVDDVVDHEPPHHVVLGRRVLTARARLDEAVAVQPVVVARDDLVQN